jgi:vitamin-K-epoxide reductase (warfarin-sensitive)
LASLGFAAGCGKRVARRVTALLILDCRLLIVHCNICGSRVPSDREDFQSTIENQQSTIREVFMKYLLVILAVLGIVVSALALREHYRTEGDSPCSINERWDCGIVNHSPYAMLAGIPVAALGIFGYFLMGILAARRFYAAVFVLALVGLAFSLYLAHIEKDILGVWCVYCVISLGIISVMTLLSLITTAAARRRPA